MAAMRAPENLPGTGSVGAGRNATIVRQMAIKPESRHDA
jgi:hypothetical protein